MSRLESLANILWWWGGWGGRGRGPWASRLASGLGEQLRASLADSTPGGKGHISGWPGCLLQEKVHRPEQPVSLQIFLLLH